MNKLLLIGSASAAAITTLEADYGCADSKLTADTNFATYSDFVEVEAASADVDADSCFAAVEAQDALALSTEGSAAKVACVEVVAGLDTNNVDFLTCQYTYEVAEVDDADADWSPISCVEGSSAGLITFEASDSGGVWAEATEVDCSEDADAADDDAADDDATDDDATDEDAASSITAGFAAVAVALFANM